MISSPAAPWLRRCGDVDAARILVLKAAFRIRTKNGSPVGPEACLCLITG